MTRPVRVLVELRVPPLTFGLGKTNALGWEMYALLTEVNGQQMPLAFVLTTSTAAALPHAKEHLLSDVFTWLETRCPNIRFTHSDKDPNEINACRNKVPDAKHQLCLYHCIHYIEERLGQSTPPAAYDGRLAHRVFTFIDPTWGPGVDNGNAEESYDGRIDVNDFEIHGTMCHWRSLRRACRPCSRSVSERTVYPSGPLLRNAKTCLLCHSSVLPKIDLISSRCSGSTSTCTPKSQSTSAGLGCLQRTYTSVQCTSCTRTAISTTCRRPGHIYGTAGILRRSGRSGLVPLAPQYLS